MIKTEVFPHTQMGPDHYRALSPSSVIFSFQQKLLWE